MTDEEGHDMDSAESICGALQAEAKADTGNVEQLREALAQGSGLIADVGVDLVSGVDVPAVDSKWTMFKSHKTEYDKETVSRLVVDKSDADEKRISYAAAMIPREPDKEGDVVPTPTVEKAAHDFLKSGGGVDTDHSLIDGEGEPVESWVLKEDRTFDLPGGGTETYGAGTWMVGIEWAADAWERIQSGELTGLSIYGMAEHVPLERAAKSCDCDQSLTDANPENGDTLTTDATKSDAMGSEQNDPDGDDAGGGDGGGPSTAELAASVDAMQDTIESLKDAVESDKADDMDDDEDDDETDKQDSPQEAAAELGDVHDMGAGDVLDLVQAAEGKDLSAIMDAIDSVDDGGDGEEMEAGAEESDGADTDGVEKRADEANMSKGHDGEGTREAALDDATGSTGMPSYAEAANEYEAGD